MKHCTSLARLRDCRNFWHPQPALEREDILGKLPRVLIYKRYIDDVLIIQSGERSQDLKEVLDSWHNHIVFEVVQAGEEVCFLDLKIALDKDTQRVHRTLFKKPLNVYGFVPYSSAHPKTCFVGIVKGVRKRLLCAFD